MTITAKSCAELLRKYNGWRRGGEGLQPEPKEIGLNLDFAVEVLEFQHNFLAQITDAAAADDIATLEQESRQMRARMERLECENTQLVGLVETLRAEVAAIDCTASELQDTCDRQALRIARMKYLINKTYYIGDDGNLRQALMDNLLADVALDILQEEKGND